MDISDRKEGIEVILWAAVDRPRKNIDVAEYKHIVLGLILLKNYIRSCVQFKWKIYLLQL
jgi:type I restriction enzyme M protein